MTIYHVINWLLLMLSYNASAQRSDSRVTGTTNQNGLFSQTEAIQSPGTISNGHLTFPVQQGSQWNAGTTDFPEFLANNNGLVNSFIDPTAPGNGNTVGSSFQLSNDPQRPVQNNFQNVFNTMMALQQPTDNLFNFPQDSDFSERLVDSSFTIPFQSLNQQFDLQTMNNINTNADLNNRILTQPTNTQQQFQIITSNVNSGFQNTPGTPNINSGFQNTPGTSNVNSGFQNTPGIPNVNSGFDNNPGISNANSGLANTHETLNVNSGFQSIDGISNVNSGFQSIDGISNVNSGFQNTPGIPNVNFGSTNNHETLNVNSGFQSIDGISNIHSGFQTILGIPNVNSGLASTHETRNVNSGFQNIDGLSNVNSGFQNTHGASNINSGFQNTHGTQNVNSGLQNTLGITNINSGFQNTPEIPNINSGFQNNHVTTDINSGTPNINSGFQNTPVTQNFNSGFGNAPGTIDTEFQNVREPFQSQVGSQLSPFAEMAMSTSTPSFDPMTSMARPLFDPLMFFGLRDLEFSDLNFPGLSTLSSVLASNNRINNAPSFNFLNTEASGRFVTNNPIPNIGTSVTSRPNFITGQPQIQFQNNNNVPFTSPSFQSRTQLLPSGIEFLSSRTPQLEMQAQLPLQTPSLQRLFTPRRLSFAMFNDESLWPGGIVFSETEAKPTKRSKITSSNKKKNNTKSSVSNQKIIRRIQSGQRRVKLMLAHTDKKGIKGY